MDHRDGPVPARSRRSVPGRLRALSAAPDVVVVGAGIVGAATARELAVRGVAVTLVDRGEVSSGTTGLGEGNVLASDKDVGPELELTAAGLALYDELDERLGADARIRRKGALIVHPDERTGAGEPARVERLLAYGMRCRLIGAADVRELEPELTGDIAGAAWFPDDLQCDPRAIARALAREAAAAGAEVRTGCDVAAIAVDRARRVGGVRLASGGRLRAGAVVLAAGAWSRTLAETASLDLPLEPRWGQLVRLDAPRDEPRLIRRKVVDGSYLASVTSPDPGLEVTTVVETTYEGDVLVGSSRARRGFDTTVDDAVSEAMIARAARLVPRVRDLRVAAAWAGLRPWLPDHLPAIGPSTRVPGLWLATGHEGAGVALGPVTGRLVAQAYTGERPLVNLRPFHPDRFAAQ
jgi:glycine/D-amino acid oxidase-like deaminating enzyme